MTNDRSIPPHASHTAHLGQRIRAVRRRCGMTQSELAAALSVRLGTDISRSTIGNYETGRRSMPAELLLLIADMCDVSLTVFADDAAADAPAPDPSPALSRHTNTSAAAHDALTMITQTLQARPDVVPFVLELLAAFIEEEAPAATNS